jgi:hypothetical protein
MVEFAADSIWEPHMLADSGIRLSLGIFLCFMTMFSALPAVAQDHDGDSLEGNADGRPFVADYPRMVIEVSPIKVGLQYSLEESTETKNLSAMTIGYSRTDTTTDRFTRTLRSEVLSVAARTLSASYGLSTGSFDLGFAFKGENAVTKTEELKFMSEEEREQIAKSSYEVSNFFSQESVSKISLKSDPGYFSGHLTIWNHESKTITIEDLQMAIVVGNVYSLKEEEVINLPPIAKIEVPPFAAMGTPLVWELKLDNQNSHDVMGLLQARKPVHAKINSYRLTADGVDLRIHERIAAIRDKSVEVRVIDGNGRDYSEFVSLEAKGAGATTLREVLAVLDPGVIIADQGEKTNLQSFLGFQTQFNNWPGSAEERERKLAAPEMIDFEKASDDAGAWVLTSTNRALEFDSNLKAGDAFEVLYLSKHNIVKSYISEAIGGKLVRSACAVDAQRPVVVEYCLPVPVVGGDVVSFNFLLRRNSLKTIEREMSSIRSSENRYDPMEDVRFWRWNQGKITHVDHDVEIAGPLGSIPAYGISVRIGAGTATIPLHYMVADGRYGFDASLDGNVEFHVFVPPSIAPNERTMCLRMEAPQRTLKLGRTISPPPASGGGGAACTPGNCGDWLRELAVGWAAADPLVDHRVQESRNFELEWSVMGAPRPGLETTVGDLIGRTRKSLLKQYVWVPVEPDSRFCADAAYP